MGLDVYLIAGKGTGKGKLDMNLEKNSKKHPKHLFKIGYFRSSYNSAGFNSVLTTRGVPELHYIFDNDGRKYEFKPNWEQALDRVQDAIAKWKAFMVSDEARYVATDCSFMETMEVKSGEDALKVFFKEKKEHDKHKPHTFDNYSNRNGNFYLDKSLKICGVVYGVNCISNNTAYLVHEVKPSTWKWYLDALEVVKETIEFVLRQKNKESYELHWSG